MSSIMNLNTYSMLFSSSANTSSTNPLTNLIYGGAVASRYTAKLTASLKTSLSTNFSPLSTKAYDLKSSSQNLVDTNKASVFHAKIASSNSPAVTASAQAGAKNQTYKISVFETAQAQVNKGTAVSSDNKTSMEEGNHSIKISSGGKDSIVSFNVKEGQTNKEALSTMALAINQSKSGVTAKVVEDDKTKTSYIEITGNETGAKNNFSIADVSGNAVESTGMGNVGTASRDAKYKVDDKEYTSSTNNISLDNGKVKVKLNAVTDKQAEITVKEDNKSIEDGITSFVEDFNKTLEASSSSDSALAQKLGNQLKSIVSSKQGSLGAIGINVKADGSLEVDKEKLAKSLENEPDKVKRAIGGFDGIASKTKSLSDRLLVSSSFESSGNTLNSNALDSLSYLKNASKSTLMRNQATGLFVNMLL